MNPLLRGSAAHVFVESLAAPVLRDDDEHHLRRVLRIRQTDSISVSDGAGGWLVANLLADGLCVVSSAMFDPAPPNTSVFSAIPKGDRPEWIVQKLTEVGVTSIGFIHCARSVVQWDESRRPRQLERLRRVAREAAMQSRRLWLPQVCDVLPFDEAIKSISCAIADPDGDAMTADVDTVLVGPEGGFTEGELGAAARRVAFSGNVLRVETAALTAAILLTQRNERT
ncbi:MAG: RsmE family RNA methyltransferase [Ilumatobacteraceae bacterium]